MSTIPRNVPLPTQVRVRLHFNDYFILTSAAGIGAYTYSGNSVYSPDTLVGTAQPYYFDRYSALYQRYCVLSSTIQLRAATDTGSNQCLMFALAPFYLNTFPATTDGMREIIEAPYAKNRMLVNAPVKA